MVDYNSTIPTFDQIEGNTLLQKMREMYNVLSENIKSEGAITKVKFENGIIEFSNEESTIASVDLSGVVINANLEGNSLVFTKIDNSKFSVSLEGLITDETAVLESRIDNIDDEVNNLSEELTTISSKVDSLETNVNKSFVNASFDVQTSILTLTALDGTFVKVTIPSGGGSGGGNVSDVTYDDDTKTITVNYVTGEPKVYTITELIGLTDKLTTIENNINSNIEEITALETFQINYTPKIDNSFVNATKIDDTTLRLTRNDGTTVDISFPEGLNERNVNLTSWQDITANTNEIVLITGSFIGNEINNKTLRVTGLGYLEVVYINKNGSKIDKTLSQVTGGVDFSGALNTSQNVTISGLLFNGGKVTAS